MASLRSFADIGDWRGCERDSFDFAGPGGIAPIREVVEPKRNLLAKTIEADIIPRLMLAHKGKRRSRDAALETKVVPTAEDVGEFTRLLLAHDVSVASSYVEALSNQGVDIEHIFLGLFAPSARLLGDLWKADICDFTDVTIGVSRLQQLLRELAPDFERKVDTKAEMGLALLVTAPGDQHTFGVYVLQEFFRRAGWEVEGGFVDSLDQLLDMVGGQNFDLIGLSVSNEVSDDEVGGAIKAIRAAATSPHVRVMVGGRFFLEHPESVARVGADATAIDGRRAVSRLSSLLRTKLLR